MRTGVICFVLLSSLVYSTKETTAEELQGLSVREGQLLLAGKPYRGVGVNYFSLFSRTLKNGEDETFRRGLKQLSKAGIPFVRFMACGFWPIDWELYLNDKQEYFRRLDAVVRCAEEHDIGLVPSLFWNMATLPDVVGEPIDAWGNAESKTIAMMRQYTKELVLRYRTSRAVWGWEFGNEYNLHVDLPNAATHRPPVVPKLKTALQRSERDELTSTMMLFAYGEFAKTVREHDQQRIIVTGNSIPRPNAYHNSMEKSWKKDSLSQFEEILLRDNPAGFDLLSVHIYPKENGYSAHAQSLTELVAKVQQITQRHRRPLFIGEFGAAKTLGAEEERARFLELLGAIEDNQIALAATWVFDFERQDRDWNVTFENERAYMLKMVGEVNERLGGDSR